MKLSPPQLMGQPRSVQKTKSTRLPETTHNTPCTPAIRVANPAYAHDLDAAAIVYDAWAVTRGLLDDPDPDLVAD